MINKSKKLQSQKAKNLHIMTKNRKKKKVHITGLALFEFLSAAQPGIKPLVAIADDPSYRRYKITIGIMYNTNYNTKNNNNKCKIKNS